MRTIVTPRRRTAEVSSKLGGAFRGRLAEDYDGIGQYVLVALASSSVTAAFKARIAAGDFGGGRTFPRGTPVVLAAHRGLLEVLSLGNRPQPCRETFSREQDDPDASEIRGIPWQQAWWWRKEYDLVDGEALVINSKNSIDHDAMHWLASSRSFQLPIEITFEFVISVNPYPPIGILQQPFLEMGIDYDFGTLYNNNDETVSDPGNGLPYLRAQAAVQPGYSALRHRWEILVFNDWVNLPITEFPSDLLHSGGGALSRTDNLSGITQFLKMRVTDPDSLDELGRWGTYGKWWVGDEEEPADWQAYQVTTNPVPSGYDPEVGPNEMRFNAIYFDDFEVSETGTVSAQSKLKTLTMTGDCLQGGFEPSARVGNGS